MEAVAVAAAVAMAVVAVAASVARARVREVAKPVPQLRQHLAPLGAASLGVTNPRGRLLRQLWR